MKRIRRFALIGILVVLVIAAFGFVQQPKAPAQANSVFSLQAPAFMSVARAAEEESITSVIEDEAGISAYFQATTPINMESVKDVFRTIEYEDEDCIVGSVEVLNYPESEDVHVLVCSDGWILAYYLAADPAGKIFDWRFYKDSGHTLFITKLENTLMRVASYGVVNYEDCTYYDFRYPNATHLMLIGDWVYGTTDYFEVNLPGDFVFDQRSWSYGSTDWGWYKLDGATIVSENCNGWCTYQGIFTLSQFLPNVDHTIELWAEGLDHTYAGLALVYRVP